MSDKPANVKRPTADAAGPQRGFELGPAMQALAARGDLDAAEQQIEAGRV